MFSKILLPSAVFGLLLSAPSLSAQTFTWDGGAGDGQFGSTGNWSGTGTPSFTTGEDFVINDGSAVTVSNDFSIGEFILDGNNGSFIIDSGSTFTANSGVSFMDQTSSMTINGTLDAQARFDFRGNGGSLLVDVNNGGSLLLNNGNGTITDGADVTFNINDGGVWDYLNKAPFGRIAATVSASYDHRANIGGTVNLLQDLELQADTNGGTHTSAFVLEGGILDFGAHDYVYTNLDTSNASNGIIFDDVGSTITLSGNRVSDVNTWIADDALRSNVGSLAVSYDSSTDLTTVIPEPSTAALFLGFGGACFALIRRRR